LGGEGTKGGPGETRGLWGEGQREEEGEEPASGIATFKAASIKKEGTISARADATPGTSLVGGKKELAQRNKERKRTFDKTVGVKIRCGKKKEKQ